MVGVRLEKEEADVLELVELPDEVVEELELLVVELMDLLELDLELLELLILVDLDEEDSVELLEVVDFEVDVEVELEEEEVVADEDEDESVSDSINASSLPYTSIAFEPPHLSSGQPLQFDEHSLESRVVKVNNFFKELPQ